MKQHPVILEDFKTIGEALRPIAPALNEKTLVLTGGAGFLGRFIIGAIEYLNAFLDRPCRLIVLDNLITGVRDAFEESEHLRFIQHSVNEPVPVAGPVHYIIHAAGIASPVFYKKYPLETLDVGALGTRNMLEMARDKKVQSFLLLSSSEVYGDPDPHFVPTPETYSGNVSCVGPRACYDEAKRISETYAVYYHQVHKIPTKIVRPFNVYGPGMRLDDRRVVPNFVLAALRGDQIPVYGDGNHTRSFCYVTDAITGLFQVLLSPYNAEAFNIGNDTNEMTMGSLATAVSSLFGGKIPVGRIISPNDAYARADPARRCPDLRKITTFVGYSANVDLMTGLGRFVTWAKDQDWRAIK